MPDASRRLLPVATVLTGVIVLWYLGAVLLNAPGAIERVLAPKGPYGAGDLVAATWSMERPVLPAPHQVAIEFYESVFEREIDSPRSLVYHAYVTGSATLVGFAFGTLLGILLALAIVRSRTLDRSLLPWIIEIGRAHV